MFAIYENQGLNKYVKERVDDISLPMLRLIAINDFLCILCTYLAICKLYPLFCNPAPLLNVESFLIAHWDITFLLTAYIDFYNMKIIKVYLTTLGEKTLGGL